MRLHRHQPRLIRVRAALFTSQTFRVYSRPYRHGIRRDALEFVLDVRGGTIATATKVVVPFFFFQQFHHLLQPFLLRLRVRFRRQRDGFHQPLLVAISSRAERQLFLQKSVRRGRAAFARLCRRARNLGASRVPAESKRRRRRRRTGASARAARRGGPVGVGPLFAPHALDDQNENENDGRESLFFW